MLLPRGWWKLSTTVVGCALLVSACSQSLDTISSPTLFSEVVQDRVEASSLIYLGNPTVTEISDVAIALATLQLDSPTPQAIADRANDLLDAPGLINVASFDPLPTACNLNYVDVGSSPLSLVDVAALLARIQVGPDPATLATRINELLDTPNLVTLSDITFVPGVAIPGPCPSPSPSPSPISSPSPSPIPSPSPSPIPSPTPSTFTISPEVTALGGNIQISVEIPFLMFTIPNLEVGGVSYFQNSIELYSGFTTYLVNLEDAFTLITFDQVEITGLTASDCIIVHQANQDPALAASRLGASAACIPGS